MRFSPAANAFEAQQEAELVAHLRQNAELLPEPDDSDAFGTFFARFGDAKLVLLGEATHGTSEFYRARDAITRRLVTDHGFTIVAVEADWPDANRIDRYVRHRRPEPSREEAIARFPTWMWRNVEIENFVEWLRAENEHKEPLKRVEFRGLDIYSLNTSIVAVLVYLDRVDPAAAKLARERYACLAPWLKDPARYGHSAAMGADTCEDEVIRQLEELLKRRLDYIGHDGDEFFDAAQNARVVRAAEEYYRHLYRGAVETWNLRDRHMFDTLQSLLRRRGPDAKAVVWAHNSHIGNAAATSMGWQGEFNIGELCRIAYGNDVAAIGFGTDRGTVAAASDWDSAMEIKRVLPAREDSYESLFRRTGLARSLTDWRLADRKELRDRLAIQRLERAIGVVYRPETELLSHYFDAVLADQFDAYVWFETTHAITPLPREVGAGMPETYPFGL